MRIIKPIAINSDIATSNAPPTDAPAWLELGRDFARELGTCMITANDTKIYALNRNTTVFNNSIKVQVVSSGVTTYLSLNSVDIVPKAILVSPDDAYIAITGSSKVQIYSLSTGNRVYNRDNTYTSYSRGREQCGIAWASDSSNFAFWTPTILNPSDEDRNPVMIAVSTTGFGEVISDSTPSDYRDPGWTSVLSDAVGIVFNSAGTELYGFAQTLKVVPSPLNEQNIMMKMTVATGVSSGAQIATLPTLLVNNQTRGEVIGTTLGDVIIYSAADFSLQAVKPDLSGVVRNSESTILHLSGSNDLYLRDESKAVGYVLFSMVDYTSSALIDPTEQLLITEEITGHIVTAEGLGFGLFTTSPLTEITSINPSVVATNIYTYSGRVYEVLTNNTDRPDQGALLDPPTWLDLGVVNPLRMFDGKLDSLTVADAALVVEITPGVIVNGIAIFNIDATTVQIKMNDPADGLVYDSGEIELIDSGTITGWYEFFFGQRLQKFDVVKVDLPTYPNATITITALDADEITIGEIVAGKNQTLGVAQYGTSVGIIDFSRKEQDQFGNFVITPRRFSKRAEYDIKVNTPNNAGLQRTLADFRTTPIVWIGDEDKLETVVYGYYRNFDILLAGPTLSDCTITVEGL